MTSSTIVILGMHRSGTSCLTNILARAGMYLGTELMEEVAHGNLEGHGEALKAVRINDRILQRSGGSWSQVPPTLEVDPETVDQITAFVEELRPHPVAGWKDPRTTITFPVWKPHLADYRLIVRLRHPLNVAHSLRVREGWPVERGLELWAAYNERLLGHLERERQDVSWFDFEAPEAELLGTVQALCESLGLKFERSAAEGFNPFLRHHKNPASIPDPRIKALYDRLRDRAASGSLRPRTVAARPAVSGWAQGPEEAAPRDTVPAEASLAVPLTVLRGLLLSGGEKAVSRAEVARRDDQHAEACTALENRLTQLARVQRLQDELLQQAMLRQVHLGQAVPAMHQQFQEQLEGLRQESRQQLVDTFAGLREHVTSVGQADQAMHQQQQEQLAGLRQELRQQLADTLAGLREHVTSVGLADRQRADLEVLRARDELLAERNQRIQELQARLAAAEGGAERLQAECQGLQSTAAVLRQGNEALEQAVREQAEQLTVLRQSHAAELTALTTELTQLRERVLTGTVEADRLRGEVAAGQADLARVRDEAALGAALILSLRGQLAACEEEAERLRADLAARTAELRHAEAAGDEVRERLRESAALLHAIRQSRSWRLIHRLKRTARGPRRVASFLRRLAARAVGVRTANPKTPQHST